MPSKTTSFIVFKSQKYRTCYAGRGLRSGTPRWGYPSHRYRGGSLPFTKPWAATPLRRPLPASHVWMVNISVPNHANMALTKTKKYRMILRQITMSLDRQNRAYKTCQNGTAELFSSSGQSPLIFDPLDNRNPSLLVNYQKVSPLEESQEVGMKWGLGRSASPYICM